MEAEFKGDLRALIIEKASELFISQGYEKTTIRQIATACNLGRGHLYYYFKKKEEIILYLYKSLIEKIYDYINRKHSMELEPLVSYAIIQYIYIYIISKDQEIFRIYIESSGIDSIRNEYIEILKEILKDKIEHKNYNFTEKDINLSIIIGSAGESELLRRYCNKENDLNLEDIITSIIKTRLLLLNIDSDSVNDIINKAIDKCNSVDYSGLAKYIR